MNENLVKKRQSIQGLLTLGSPADALTSYYALHHPAERTTLVVHRAENGRVDGFLALSQTGMDLFRPLLTMRAANTTVAANLIESTLPPEAAVIVSVPLDLRPVIEAFFIGSGETVADIFQLSPPSFRPVINVLVTRSPSPSGDPSFVIRGRSFDRGAQPVGPILAKAGVNWRSPHYADIYVDVDPKARGRDFGKSVVSALSSWLLEKKVAPLYTVAVGNKASIRLAQSLGFVNTGYQVFMCDAVRRVSAFPFHKSVVE